MALPTANLLAAATAAASAQPQLPTAVLGTGSIQGCTVAPPPPPTPLERSKTEPPTPSRSAFQTPVSQGGMSLCFVGDPALPFADVTRPTTPGGLLRARTSQDSIIVSSRSLPRRLSTPMIGTASTPLVNGQLLGEDAARLRPSISLSSPQISVAGTPLSGAAPTPINVEHWSTVGQRLANVFGDASLLSSPGTTPMAGATPIGTRTFSSSVAESTMDRALSDRSFAKHLQMSASPFCMPTSSASNPTTPSASRW